MAILPAMQVCAPALLIETHVPAPAVGYCLELWREHPFQLQLRKSRTTKLGDFSCRPGRPPRITINADSHPFLFLLTYVHEVAHMRVHHGHGFRVAPHGKEWKESFRKLCSPLLELNIFPDPIAEALRVHLLNPRASCMNDARLSRILQDHDHRFTGTLRLVDLPEGSQFELHGRWFQKIKLNRTRVVCRELGSRRHFLIAAHAPVGQT